MEFKCALYASQNEWMRFVISANRRSSVNLILNKHWYV